MEDRLRYLFGRYLENNCSHRELDEFLGYIRKAEHNDLLRQLIKNVYTDLEGTRPLSTFVDDKGRLVLTEPSWIAALPTGKQRKIKPLLVTITAIIVILIVTVFLFSPTTKKTPVGIASLTRKTTDRSEYKFILLEDSTQVWLNAASSLEFPDNFANNKREVYLSGEAFFDVKHADKIPFIIHTGGISTTVLGTAFNIKAYPDQKNITVSVSRGKVKVSDQEGWTAFLLKGEQVKIATKGKEMTEKNIPVAGVAAWQHGSMVYDDETLHDIIADMERVYNVTIQLGNQSIQDLKISTSFKKEIGIEQALQVLCKLTDTQFKHTDNIYIIQ